MTKPSPQIVHQKLITTGMHDGWHSRLAVIGVIASIIIGIVSRSASVSAFGVFFTASAVGLLGEARFLALTGEVIVRRYRPRFPPTFISIKRIEAPMRFAFYLYLYITLGVFSLIVGALLLLSMVYESS